MEQVCEEIRRKYTWFFNDGVYIQKDKEGNERGRIEGSNLPDPYEIKMKRMQRRNQGLLGSNTRIDPDPVTAKLWSHWNAYINA